MPIGLRRSSRARAPRCLKQRAPRRSLRLRGRRIGIRIKVGVERGVQGIQINSREYLIGPDGGDPAVGIIDIVIQDDILRHSGSRGFVNAAAGLVIAGVRIDRANMGYAVSRYDAVGEKTRSRPLDVDAVKSVHVHDDVVRNLGVVGSVEENSALDGADEVGIDDRAIPRGSEDHTLAPEVDAIPTGKISAISLADHVPCNATDSSVGDKNPELVVPGTRSHAGNGVPSDFRRDSGADRQDSVSIEVVDAVAVDRNGKRTGLTAGGIHLHAESVARE